MQQGTAHRKNTTSCLGGLSQSPLSCALFSRCVTLAQQHRVKRNVCLHVRLGAFVKQYLPWTVHANICAVIAWAVYTAEGQLGISHAD